VIASHTGTPRLATAIGSGLRLAVFLLLSSCGTDGDNGVGPPPGDTTPPAAVTSLIVHSPTTEALTLTWAAVGDDSLSGTASQYDIRYASSASTPWEQMTQVESEPTPKSAGQYEEMTIPGLSGNLTYTFRMRVADEVPNWSAISQPVTGTTASHWSPLATGVDGHVIALTVYNGELIAGGDFLTAGGVTVSNIARWDGAAWAPMGTGIVGYVGAFTEYNGNLVAGGLFTRAGDVNVNDVATWDGTAWGRLGAGADCRVSSLAAYQGNVIAGCGFGLEQYDGTTWTAMDLGEGGVSALAVHNDELIVGGIFQRAGEAGANSIASWDGTTWSALGSGMLGGVWAVAVYNGNVIAGGLFSTAGGVPANNIAQWDGSSWSPLGSGLDDQVFALAVYNGDLIVGGRFVNAGGVPARWIARWDGTTWEPMGAGMGNGYIDGWVEALTVHEGRLIAGGMFITADGLPAGSVAAWSD
jgi:hypothetical protein